jgi:hypothetical protein
MMCLARQYGMRYLACLPIKDRRDAYEITSQSVRLCAPTITFEPVSRLYQLQQGGHAYKFDLDSILLIS